MLDGAEMPLGERGISRTPLQICRDRHDEIRITVPDSRMLVQLNGAIVDDTAHLRREQLEAGVVIMLGGCVLLCLHWVRTLPKASAIPQIIGGGSAAVRLRSQIAQAAATDLPVLLLGETGTGKEVAAQAIHAASGRARGPIVAVNMATLNDSLGAADLFGAVKGAYTGAQTTRQGLFAEAEGGTLFLDEIGDAPAPVQPMLLRVLESGEYRPVGGSTVQRCDVRLIAATDRDLGAHGFNQPLLRRLEGFVIHVPPLRKRREDIGLLILHFLREWQCRQQAPQLAALPFSLVSQMCNYDWPGNVRQLAHTVRRAAIALAADEPVSLHVLVGHVDAAPSSHPAHGAAPAGSAPSLPTRSRKRLETLSDDDVLDAMERNGWQILAASRALGISRPSLYKLLESHSCIRPADAIAAAELRDAWLSCGGDATRCASVLRTPGDALRRRLREEGLID